MCADAAAATRSLRAPSLSAAAVQFYLSRKSTLAFDERQRLNLFYSYKPHTYIAHRPALCLTDVQQANISLEASLPLD